jgi:hypothetical protein
MKKATLAQRAAVGNQITSLLLLVLTTTAVAALNHPSRDAGRETGSAADSGPSVTTHSNTDTTPR